MSQPPVEEPGDRREPERGPRPWVGVLLPVLWLSLGLLGGYLVITVVGSGDDAPATAETTQGPPSAQGTTGAEKPKAKPKAKRTPKSEPTTEPTTEATTEPTQEPVTRSIPVSVYNQIGIGGLARRVAGQAQALGWPIGAVSDWRGGVPQDTVYFPAGRQGEAELLGRDLGIGRIMPAIANMSSTGLTVVLASPR